MYARWDRSESVDVSGQILMLKYSESTDLRQTPAK